MYPIKKDGRYQIAREYCGYPEPRWVVRFCGEWIGQAEHKSDAVIICRAYAAGREAAMTAA